MFGLMRAQKCEMSAEEKNFRRLNYCGTCKTIGALYGQKSRFLLNYDTVFLAEILTALSGEEVANRQSAYQSYNCLNLPTDKMPASLQFAATTNVILAHFKLEDHISDEDKKRYNYAQKAFSREFEKAENLLKGWSFPLDKVKEILQTQISREAQHLSLDDFAEPTALTTAEFFAHGVLLIEKSQLKDSAFNLGFNFGKLIYILDAVEDYEKDFRKKQFNAVRAAFQSNENKIPIDVKRKVFAVLRELENEIVAAIYELPIEEKQKTLFASRLQNNLERKLKTGLPIIKTKKVCHPKPKETFSRKWKTASQTAKNLARSRSWQMPLVFLFVFGFVLIAPAAQTREVKSARECFDLSFNLMFLGSMLSGGVISLRNIFLENPEELLTKNGRRKRLKNVSGDGGDQGSGWCDGCECCCECGEGGCCEGCGCCSGCCESCGCDGCCCDCSCD